MSKETQCKSTKVVHGEVLRCECLRGHSSVHYCGSEWWPNEQGLPKHYQQGWIWIIAWILLALFLAGAVYMLFP